MKQKTLTIKHEQEVVQVTGTADEISRLISWVKEHKRGKFSKNTIVCDLPNDFIACRQKSKFLKLNVLDSKVNVLEKKLLV